MSDHTLVVFNDTALESATEPNSSVNVIVISRKHLNDFDYLFNKVQEVMEDSNLNGPEQARIVIDIASSFLAAYDEPLDLPGDCYGDELPLPETGDDQ